MTGLDLQGIGPFDPAIGPKERGERALRLTRACAVSHDAKPVALALGRIADPEGRAEALRAFAAMAPASQARVHDKYKQLSKGRP